MTVVRSEAGKTYGASSSFDRNLERGAWVATTFTRTGETLETVALVRGELEKMAAAGPTDDEVAAAIAHLAGGYALRMDSADDLAAALITADLHGLSEAYVANFPLLVGKVTRDEAAAAAAELLTPDNLAVVLVGDGDKLAPVLEASACASSGSSSPSRSARSPAAVSRPRSTRPRSQPGPRSSTPRSPPRAPASPP
jgi:zinc protease